MRSPSALLVRARLAGVEVALGSDGEPVVRYAKTPDEGLLMELRANRDDIARELRDPLRSVRRTVWTVAAALGWPRASPRPALTLGGSRDAWGRFCARAPEEELRAAFSALEHLDEETGR